MSYQDPHWLQERYKNYTDDDLHDRYRELTVFGDDDAEKLMIEQESKRREKAND